MSAMDTGLMGEYAAIYAYGAAAVHLGDDARSVAKSIEAEHRDRRDYLLDFYDARDLDAPTPEAGYDIDSVTDAAGAAAVLTAVEERLATAWRAGVASEDPAERALCLEMLSACAKALARWRSALGEIPTEPWPGRPEGQNEGE